MLVGRCIHKVNYAAFSEVCIHKRHIMDTFLIEQSSKTNRIQFLGCFPRVQSQRRRSSFSGADISFNASRYKSLRNKIVNLRNNASIREPPKKKKSIFSFFKRHCLFFFFPSNFCCIFINFVKLYLRSVALLFYTKRHRRTKRACGTI